MGFDRCEGEPFAETHIVTYALGRVHGSAANQPGRMRFVSRRLQVGDQIATHFLDAALSEWQVINQLPVERVNPDVESSSKNSDVRHRTVVGFRLLAVLARSGWGRPRWWRRWASPRWRRWRPGFWSGWRRALTQWQGRATACCPCCAGVVKTRPGVTRRVLPSWCV
ncbi:hypothetical protein ALQ83_200205 [Pseudomonas syringae pv. berberidis]|nr:hypothetical protein ALQ83_200205 [Pseudomonas syringae pv. berberidis]